MRLVASKSGSGETTHFLRRRSQAIDESGKGWVCTSVITSDTYITASEICDLLRKVAAEYAGKPIHIVLDNARYQKCAIVTELAIQLGIHLVYILPYSPNLNHIERLWKYVKNKLRTKYYNDFGAFQKKIDSIMSDTDTNDNAIINKLIGEKVQLFNGIIDGFDDII